MRRKLTHAAATAATALLAASLVIVTATPAAASAVRVPPASVQGDCGAGTVPVVVASDVSAQSDIYSAVTLAGVLGDACIVLAGPRNEAIPADQQARLDDSAAVGYVVGGQAAVPDGKLAGRTMARLGGADRWATALLVGFEAADPGSAPTTTISADVHFDPSPSSLPATAATRVRVPPASVRNACGSDTVPVVVASDLAAQSDIYSAATLAGVLGDACIILAGERGEAMPPGQQARLDAAAEGGYVVGGQAAVPDAKVAGRTMARLGGADRWATALLVGEEAAEPGSALAAALEADSRIDQIVSQLNELTVTAEQAGGYDRSLFKHWVDADGDGCDARKEVLLAEAVVAPTVRSGCALSGGEWLSRYDAKTTTGSGSAFDVDHLVPLAEAWESGARSWSADRREQYANDLGYPDSLIAVSASSNRSKGAKDPAEWLPPAEGVHCWYAAAWVQVKTRWDLTVDRTEADKLSSILSGCDNDDLGNLPEGPNSGSRVGAGRRLPPRLRAMPAQPARRRAQLRRPHGGPETGESQGDRRRALPARPRPRRLGMHKLTLTSSLGSRCPTQSTSTDSNSCWSNAREARRQSCCSAVASDRPSGHSAVWPRSRSRDHAEG